MRRFCNIIDQEVERFERLKRFELSAFDSQHRKRLTPFQLLEEKHTGTGLPPNGLLRKRAGAVFLDDRPVLGVEFGAVAKAFVHDGIGVIDMLRAENMS
jgi:hypothetical protein